MDGSVGGRSGQTRDLQIDYLGVDVVVAHVGVIIVVGRTKQISQIDVVRNSSNARTYESRLLDQDRAAAQVTGSRSLQIQHQVADCMLGMGHVMQRLGYAVKGTLSTFAAGGVLKRWIILQYFKVLL